MIDCEDASFRTYSRTELIYLTVYFPFSSIFGQAAADAIKAKQDSENAEAEENEDEPPKAEVKQIVEDDAIHSVRYKIPLTFLKSNYPPP